MSTFSSAPRIAKGALIGLDALNPLASVVVFQYNPDSISRSLRANVSQDRGGGSEPLRLKGPPSETITLDVDIDAADQLERGDPMTLQSGIAPELASLELMLYPKSTLVIANAALTLAGLIEIVPPEAPLALLVWGTARVLPVRLSELSITEEAFDPALNPIRAKVHFSVEVLTYDDLGIASIGGALSLAQQIVKEGMATINSISAIGSFSAPANVRIGT